MDDETAHLSPCDDLGAQMSYLIDQRNTLIVRSIVVLTADCCIQSQITAQALHIVLGTGTA